MSEHKLNDPAYWDALIANYEAQAQPFTTHFAQAALAKLDIGPATRVLDIATGTGSLALAAAETGAQVLAIDFSAGMVERVLSHGRPGLEARQMNGQALDLPDASFDAVFSIFGIMLFADWRAGLREMARVTRPDGTGVLAVWKTPGCAATNLLLLEVITQLYPDLVPPPMPAGIAALAEPKALSEAMVDAGFSEPEIAEVTHDFRLEIAALDDADRLFALIPMYSALATQQRAAVLGEIRVRAERERVGSVLPIPSTALIATARGRPPDMPT